MDRRSQISILLEDPATSALITDIDGTLCRIVGRPERAKVPARARKSLEILGERFGTVACVSGRPARVARSMVGVDSITYFGNHGLELIAPEGEKPTVQLDPDEVRRPADFVRQHDNPFWVAAGIRIEDKGPIQALHWRGADERTEAQVQEIATEAEQAGLAIHWGRKVLELRPRGMAGKAGAVEQLLDRTGVETVAFAGDDRTDLDAAIRLREMKDRGEIARLILVAVASEEGPPELVEMADIVLDDPDEWLDLVEFLAVGESS